MLRRYSFELFAVAAALAVAMGGARAADEAKYPNWKGPVDRPSTTASAARSLNSIPTKPWGVGSKRR